jgi:hypothetical protein
LWWTQAPGGATPGAYDLDTLAQSHASKYICRRRQACAKSRQWCFAHRRRDYPGMASRSSECVTAGHQRYSSCAAHLAIPRGLAKPNSRQAGGGVTYGEVVNELSTRHPSSYLRSVARRCWSGYCSPRESVNDADTKESALGGRGPTLYSTQARCRSESRNEMPVTESARR